MPKPSTIPASKYIGVFVISLFFSQITVAESIRFKSTEAQVGLLELYTSEGCSSCPPADRWLSSLKHDKGLWKEFIPAAFHVNYWDYIGWKDPFATKRTTNRQRAYARQESVVAVYTPGFVYNGEEWKDWFNAGRRVFPEGSNPGVLELSIDGNSATAYFYPNDTHKNLFINVAVLGFDLKTKVNAGENRGRELSHDFVVLGLDKKRLTRREEGFQARLRLPENRTPAPRYGVVAWVSNNKRQGPIQATGGFVPLTSSGPVAFSATVPGPMQ